MTPNIHIKFNEYIDSLMMSREQIASVLDINTRTLYRYISGDQPIPLKVFFLVEYLAKTSKFSIDKLVKARNRAKISENTISIINANDSIEDNDEDIILSCDINELKQKINKYKMLEKQS